MEIGKDELRGSGSRNGVIICFSTCAALTSSILLCEYACVIEGTKDVVVLRMTD